jgi:hypothetical protein
MISAKIAVESLLGFNGIYLVGAHLCVRPGLDTQVYSCR